MYNKHTDLSSNLSDFIGTFYLVCYTALKSLDFFFLCCFFNNTVLIHWVFLVDLLFGIHFVNKDKICIYCFAIDVLSSFCFCLFFFIMKMHTVMMWLLLPRNRTLPLCLKILYEILIPSSVHCLNLGCIDARFRIMCFNYDNVSVHASM